MEYLRINVTAQSKKINFAPATIEDEVTQNVMNIFNQRRNQIPYQRDMGLDSRVIDESIDVVMMFFQTDMARQIRKYEPRAKVKYFEWRESDLINGNIVANVVIEVKEGAI